MAAADNRERASMAGSEARYLFQLDHPDLARVRLTFLPAASILVTLALATGGYAVLPVLLGLVHGLLWWSFLEYLMHRYLLHWEPKAPRWQAVRRALPGHRSHHDDPGDPDDVVSVKHSFGIPLAVLGLAASLATGYSLAFSLATIAGAALGYAAYEYVHFACHQLPVTSRIGRYVRRHHGIHHHRDETVNFGVTSPLWDYVFGTIYRPGR
ncbi:MAG: hypothetical protein D6754_00460 [Alphaproteobacteria bacterium]|nr:MAG: hypothetical protein D6754_00460 [Alphaproteobacteria bacterium]